MPLWTLPSPTSNPVRGDSHAPREQPRAIALLAHGFKGYKDYGFIPVLAAELARRLPITCHRFNFSHSGMGERIDSFERPDLFERDTWSKQIADLRAVAAAAQNGELPDTPASLPLVLVGHSRGGAACLLAAGREGSPLAPRAIITLAAPSACCSMSADEQRALLARGHTITTSARTGQDLRIDAAWLQEQLDDPGAHDVLACCARIACPVLALHGAADPTVPPSSARAIATAGPNGAALVIDNCNHVFNTPNPADPAQPMSPQLTQAIEAIEQFVSEAL